MEIGVLRNRKEPKAKKSIAEALLREMEGTGAEKLALFKKTESRRWLLKGIGSGPEKG
jgi:hypothetical protein